MNYWLSQQALEDEAKRRCLAAGYTLEFPAKNLTSFDAGDIRPLWRAHYLPQVQAEAEEPVLEPRTLAWWLVAGFMLSSPAFLAAGFTFFWGAWR